MKNGLIDFFSDFEAVVTGPEVVWNDWIEDLEIDVIRLLPQDHVDPVQRHVEVQEYLLLELVQVL